MRPEAESYLSQLRDRYLDLKRDLKPLSDEDFEDIKSLSSKRHQLDVASFLADFALEAEERRRNEERWAKGSVLPEATDEQEKRIRFVLPKFVSINPEAVSLMSVEPARTFQIDLVVEDILQEIALRLPRKIDAYRYRQDYAQDSIEVPGLGKVEVKLHETGDGIFRTISSVEGEDFRIWNCRFSGVTYQNRRRDISRPSEIKIKPLRLEIDLYEDDSGIFVGLGGRRFTNARWETAAARGHTSDSERDDLHRTWSGPNDMAEPEEGYISNKGWRNDKTVLSWEKIENQAISWLVENVLIPLKNVPKPESQEVALSEEEPFPEGKVGPLFTFVEFKDLRRISLTKDNPNKAYPDERRAVRPGRRLVPLNIPSIGFPEAAYDSFIWCGVGKIDDSTDLGKVKIADRERRSWGVMGDNEGAVIVKPKTATDIYVVNWQAWDDIRGEIFRGKPDDYRASGIEVAEMYQAVASTMVAITEYEGNYENPIVLIGRDLELGEVASLMFFPPEEEIGKY